MTEVRDRIAVTYMTAMRAAHASKEVRVHVGQGVWDWLSAQANVPDGGVANAVPNRLFGFPIHLEAAWPVDLIVVRTDEWIW